MFAALTTRFVPTLATAGVAIALLLGSVTSANAQSSSADQAVETSATQLVGSVFTGRTAPAGTAAPADVTIQDSTCRTHNPPGAGSARACRTWFAVGGGYYDGSWDWTGSSGVYVQGSFDGDVIDLPHSGYYLGVKRFLTRGCKAGNGCTGWS